MSQTAQRMPIRFLSEEAASEPHTEKEPCMAHRYDDRMGKFRNGKRADFVQDKLRIVSNVHTVFT